nr:MAG TPA: hypothetical protein [Caudoviricetes sp.]
MFTVKIMTSEAAFRDGQVDASGNYPLDPTSCEIRRLLKLISQNLEKVILAELPLITTETKSGNGNWRTKNVRSIY